MSPAARSLVTAGGPIAAAVTLAIGSASLTRAPQPRLVPLGSHTGELLEGAGLTTGSPEAPLVVRVVGDYECGACEELDRVAGRVLRAWAREGRIRYQLIQAPLRAHRRAPKAAAAFYCAAREGAAWPMHDLLVSSRAEWGWGPDPVVALRGYAAGLGLDSAHFDACLHDPGPAQLERDRAAAAALGVASVPVILVDSVLVRPTRSFDEILDYVRDRLEATG